MAVFPTRSGMAHLSKINPGASAGVLTFIVLLGCYCGLQICWAQTTTQPSTSTPPAANSTATTSNSTEIATHDEPTFKVNVKLVLVRVVVRDSHGHAVGNLHKEDFQVFDRGKPQVVSQFSMEQPGARIPEKSVSEPEPGSTPEVSPAAKPAAIPQRFTAYLFDDVHLAFGDLAQVRNAAEQHLASLQPTDRAAIFSTSGQTTLDFTDDGEQLRQTLVRLQPRPAARSGVQECPDISYYMADLIVNKNDAQALNVAAQDTLVCQFQGDPKFISMAQVQAQATASQRVTEGDAESRLALGVLKDVVRRESIIPGQRSVVLVSPGFLTPLMEYDFTEIVNRALRSDIIINAIDARGLYTVIPGGDTSRQPNGSLSMQGFEAQYQMQSATAEAFVLGDLASSTGGFFFHNSNDLLEGFRRVAETPEYSYVLGFSPQGLKADGSFHALKVKLSSPEKLSIDARRGYYAPKQMVDASEEAKREIEDELFSQEELHGLPVDLHTQFFKSADAGARLSVLAHVDVKRLSFHKGEGRNRNDLTIVSGLFDRNGNYITANEKILEMRLRDATLENKLNAGITVKTSFDVKPGSYLVRLVVRDAEKQLMSAESGAVQIP